jgi:diguanylate cyclase (GGDEF)-like protein
VFVTPPNRSTASCSHDADARCPSATAFNSTTLRYTLFGILFGACFPVVGIIVDGYLKAIPLSLDAIAALFAGNPIHFIVALAPLVLGVSYHLIGRSRAGVEHELALREQTEAELRHRATHDALTGLANRHRFAESLEAALARLGRDAGGFALCLIDLDRFKLVNDLNGHTTGDRLLQAVAERLRATTREVDTVARLGGDEFALIATIAGYDPPEEAARIARRLIAAVTAPLETGSRQIMIGASVGISLAPANGADAETLLRHADLAMYRAKSEGRGEFRFFQPEMDARIRERAALEADLRGAIANDALAPYFQPQVDFASGRIVGFEMLARWPHTTRGMVPPDEFVPIAEDAGLIGAMTGRLLRRGCRAAVRWPDDIVLAVNVSSLHLRDRSLPGTVRAALAESRLPACRLELELTESALVSDFNLARDMLCELKETGVRLAIDDFGTGYSSLVQLQALPFDKIKIDAGFVRGMVEAAESRKIVAAVVGLGHNLGLVTVAEGVENRTQAEALRELGCDIGQGWLFGCALPEPEASSLAASGALDGLGKPAVSTAGR